MEIKLDTNAINEAIVRAITDSAIGDQVKQVIEKELAAKASSWDSDTIIAKAIKQEVSRIINVIIRQEIEMRTEEIRAHVAPMITDSVIQSMGSAALEVMLGNLNR